jgi:hypothetical protein
MYGFPDDFDHPEVFRNGKNAIAEVFRNGKIDLSEDFDHPEVFRNGKNAIAEVFRHVLTKLETANS